MKRKNIKRWMTGVAGATLMLNGCSAAIPEALPAPQEDPAPAKDLHVNGYKLEALEQAKVPEYLKVANVNGSFTFDQNVTTPPDEVFSIFGTALTGACAKPSFALGSEESAGDYYLNVSGSLKHAYRVNLNEVKDQEETRIMTCSCATGNAVVNADVAGVPLSAILRLDELEEHVNTITFRGADGFGIPMPLSYALENNAMIVYRAGGQELPDNPADSGMDSRYGRKVLYQKYRRYRSDCRGGGAGTDRCRCRISDEGKHCKPC